MKEKSDSNKKESTSRTKSVSLSPLDFKEALIALFSIQPKREDKEEKGQKPNAENAN